MLPPQKRARPRALASIAALLCAALAGCAARSSSTILVLPPPWPGARPAVLFEGGQPGPAQQAEAARLRSVIDRIGPELARWGDFRFAVTVHVFATHEELERRIPLESHPWLRAWSWTREIALQSPRTWEGAELEVPDAALDELLSHEFTHALMYQLIEPSDGSDRPEPPLWFREGMASYTARQGSRRMPPVELSRWVAAHPGVDLLRPAPETYRRENEAVYGAAHRAFELLLQRSGERGVRDLLRYAGEGRTFEQAFQLAIGRSIEAFEADSVRANFQPQVAGEGARTGAGGP
jgi:hypothetical protein